MSFVVKAAGYLPSVREPEKEQTLKQMLTWTGIVLLLYFTLAEIQIYGADSAAVEQALQQLETFQTLLGAEIGSIVTLGIGPIVTASIVLQMMVGSDLLPWDTNTDKGRIKFQSTQKVLAYSLCVVNALGFVLTGTFGDVTHSGFLVALLTAQIAVGGMIIIILDDLIQKWGFGSGVGLFIAAGVSKAVFVSAFSPLTDTGELYWQTGGNPVGALFLFTETLELSTLMPIVSAAAVFAVVVYMQSMRVEIPLTFGNVRGFGQKWPLKFLYTSVMPVILLVALVANFQIAGTVMAGQDGCSVLGCFSQGQATSGLVYWMSPPVDVVENIIRSNFEAIAPIQIIRILFYMSMYAIGGIIFSIFWAKTTGQGSKDVAEQISRTGMKVPGFRKDTRIIEKVLKRYIPGLAVLSGLAVGLLAALADMTQAAGGGIGVLLTVMILYRMYEQLAQKHMEELHPAMREFFE